jgi:hypothetical protein
MIERANFDSNPAKLRVRGEFTFIIDGAPNFHDAFNKEFFTLR